MEATVESLKPYDLGREKKWTEKVGILADDFILVGRNACGSLLRTYFDWNPEIARGPMNLESMLGTLTCGILWNLYSGGHAVGSPEAGVNPACRHASVIPGGDIRKEFSHFLRELELTGEFDQEALRMRRLEQFLQSMSSEKANGCMARMSEFGEWFRVRAKELLGSVTGTVDSFRRYADTRGEYRDDAALRNRHEVEYHLNLLSAVVLNCAWRDSYEAKEKKLLVLPSCMRARGPRDCRAQITPVGMKCKGCSVDCPVNKARERAGRYGISTVFLEHQSTAFDPRHANEIRREGYSIIGVACALSLQAGGWKAQDGGIPAQCIPLSYPGCSRHWTESGVTTDIDTDILIGIIEGANFAPGW